MINWVELVSLMKEFAVAFGIIMAFFSCIALLIHSRYEFSDKFFYPWEKEERKAQKKAEKERKKRLRKEAKQWR